MNLTTLERLKQRLGIGSDDVKDDDLLQVILNGVSERLQTVCNRQFEYAAAATEEVQGDETEVRVARMPVYSVSKFELKSSESEGWVEQADVDYVIRRSCVVSLTSTLGTWKSQLRVTYAGGYVLPGGAAVAGVSELPLDLEHACLEQCAYVFQNKDRLGVVSMGAMESSVSQFAKLDLLPSVEAVAQKYERWLN